MDIEVIKQTVVQLSQTFYNTQDQQQRRVAEERLNDFKKSIEAWTVTDQLLHTNTSEQVLFFAAQTIRSKIQYSFHELPPDYHEVDILAFYKQLYFSISIFVTYLVTSHRFFLYTYLFLYKLLINFYVIF